MKENNIEYLYDSREKNTKSYNVLFKGERFYVEEIEDQHNMVLKINIELLESSELYQSLYRTILNKLKEE